MAAELPDRYPGSLVAHAPVPAARGGGPKKKASAYDPSNPYFSKPPSKTKYKSSKSSNSHFDKGLGSCGNSSVGSSSQMGVIGHSCLLLTALL